MLHRPAKSKIFNPNPKKNFFKPKPDLNLIRILINFYITILAIKILKTAYNIRISIGYKDNFCQVFRINQDLDQASFNIFPKKSWFLNPNPNPTRPDPTRPRKKLVFKPKPDPISGLSRVG